MKIDPNQLNKLLRRNASALREQKTDEQCCNVLVTKIMPLLARHPACMQWMKEKADHKQRHTWLERRVLSELKDAFNILKERLLARGLLEVTAIKQRVCIIECIIKFSFHPEYKDVEDNTESTCSVCGAKETEHRVYAFPSYVHGVHEELKKLCYEIITLGDDDLLKDYVEIQYSLEYRVDPTLFQKYYCTDCRYLYNRNSAPQNFYGEPIPFGELASEWTCPMCGGKKANFLPIDSGLFLCGVAYISRFNLAPSCIELISIDDILALENRDRPDAPVWAAYETLFTIEWAWKTSRDFLRKKTLQYNNIKQCARSSQLLELNDFKIEVRAITGKGQCYLYPALCAHERIMKSLNVIFQEIGIACIDDRALLDDMIFPVRVELVLNENDVDLLLKVEWMHGLIEVCHLHSFQELESISKKAIPNHTDIFIRGLLNSPHKRIKVPSSDGASAKKYLKRAGISGVLDEFFVAYKNADSARLRETQINLTEKPIWTLRKLLNHISTLETLRWEPELTSLDVQRPLDNTR